MHAILPLLLLAFKIWMVVDAIQRKAGYIWLMVIFLLPFGEFVYFFMVRYNADPPSGTGRLDQTAARAGAPVDVATLRYTYNETPSILNQIALGQGLHDTGEYSEAADLFQAVLKQRSKERAALYGLALCQAGCDDHAAAVESLSRLIAQDKAYQDFAPWSDLADAQRASGDEQAALATLQDLAKASPRVDHKLLLARQLLSLGQRDEARSMLIEALESHSMAPAHLKKAERQAAAAARELLGGLA